LAAHLLPSGEDDNVEFRFTSFDLRVSKLEQLAVTVDGHAINIHAPVVIADTNGTDAVIEAGVNPGNTPFAGDPGAAGNVLANDFDPDSYALTVSGVAAGASAGPAIGNVGTMVTGTYGTLTLGTGGAWTYALDNADADTNALAQGEAAQDVFTYTASD